MDDQDLSLWQVLSMSSTTENTQYKTENYLVSFFGRMNYILMDRYYITATLRDDGSSRFHKDKRWGVFPLCGFCMEDEGREILEEM